MQPFEPGPAGDGGPAYRVLVWVCQNAPRNYRQCHLEEGRHVWEALRQRVGHSVLVMRAGCMLGCDPAGTTVVLASNAPIGKTGQHRICLRGVKVSDLDALVEAYLTP